MFKPKLPERNRDSSRAAACWKRKNQGMLGRRLLHSQLSGQIIGAAIEVHRQLGPGLLESVYRACLTYELQAAGRSVECEVPIPIRYKNALLPGIYRADLLIDGIALVELKSIERFSPIHDAQLLTYLKLANLRLGLLLNFNARVLRNGIRRLVR